MEHLDCFQEMQHLIARGRPQVETLNIILRNVFKPLNQIIEQIRINLRIEFEAMIR